QINHVDNDNKENEEKEEKEEKKEKEEKLENKLKLNYNISEIRKNGKKITVAKLDINNFSEDELGKFLKEKRGQKGIFAGTKKSPLQEAYNKGLPSVKSKHLRPFIGINTINNASVEILAEEERK